MLLLRRIEILAIHRHRLKNDVFEDVPRLRKIKSALQVARIAIHFPHDDEIRLRIHLKRTRIRKHIQIVLVVRLHGRTRYPAWDLGLAQFLNCCFCLLERP